MSRYSKWNNALTGISNSIQQSGVKTNNHNYSVESKIINDYAKENNIKGSFSDKVLEISDNFSNFKKSL